MISQVNATKQAKFFKITNFKTIEFKQFFEETKREEKLLKEQNQSKP